MRNQRRKTRLFRRLALAFAVALVAVPVAQAYPVEVERGAGHPGETDFPGSSYIAPQQPQQLGWPGVDPRTFGSKVVPIQVVPEPKSWPGVTGPTAAPVQVVEPDGFNWGDSGIGAGTALAVVLLAAGSLLAVRHIGRHGATTA